MEVIRTPEAALKTANELLSAHGLNKAGWKIEFSDSKEFAVKAPEAGLKDIALHEIAHALVGCSHGHDAVWKAKAVSIGSSGERCHKYQYAKGKYTLTCEGGCQSIQRDRKSEKAERMVCALCKKKFIFILNM
jgi:predicted SprT family Zn-dependent metalloprotease